MSHPSESPRGSPRPPVRVPGPHDGGLTRVGVYRRTVRASSQRVWENVRDWEHLPWLHRASFSSIESIESGRWGWRARIGLQPADPAGILLELKIEPDEPRYVSRTLEGAGAGTEIWTRVEERGEHETRVEVEFWLPRIEPGGAEAIGKAFTNLYMRLWDEDEGMMIRRERELTHRRGRPASAPEPVRLGALADVEAGLPMSVEFAGQRFRVVEHRGGLVAHSVVCPHRLGPLHEVPVEQGRIVCPWHGYAFDVETGRACHGRRLRLAAAPHVRIDSGGDVWLLPNR